jgi:hypothetical protein
VTNTSQQQEEELNKSVQEEELNKSMQEEELNKSVAAPARPLTLTRRAKTLRPRSQKLQRVGSFILFPLQIIIKLQTFLFLPYNLVLGPYISLHYSL